MGLRIYTVEEARRTVLRRQPLEEIALPGSIRESLDRLFGPGTTPAEAVSRILANVRERGDDAVREWTLRIDRVELGDLAVPAEALQAAYEALDPDLREALLEASRRIEAFHRRQPLHSWLDPQPGSTLGQLVTPIARVGLYVPGGAASYPSSLLMAGIPARVAGVEHLVVASPPQRETGLPGPGVLAAAYVVGVDHVYRIGGAQAIAALAYGTESVPAVDKVCGPGNLFVTLAKRQLMGVVGIDGLPGPTETVIIADSSARPDWVAADLLAQAEHDPLATALLLTPSRELATRVAAEVERQLARLADPRVAADSLRRRGGAVITSTVEEAIVLANAYAPEHLCLSLADPWRWVWQVRNAGGVFVGEGSCETLGDYVAGPSHVMPTGGTARFASPLSVADFARITSVIAVGPEEARRLAPAAARLARFEGLHAHAAAAEARAGSAGPSHECATGEDRRG
ncbi:MAG: histidinol dehydrogenase [Anaerolineae bacterium]|nr:histidinol dehydrogenase [Anaerolineae bacterium]